MASVAILDILNTRINSIKTKEYPRTEVYYSTKLTTINQILPFRVRFENIGVSSATANIPGIGLQVIGINNYIL